MSKITVYAKVSVEVDESYLHLVDPVSTYQAQEKQDADRLF